MANIALAYPDYISNTKYYTPDFDLTTGSWTTAAPLVNLRNPIRTLVAKSSSAAVTDTKFTVDFQVSREIQFVAILNHNLSTSATVQYQFYSDAGLTTLVHDTNALSAWTSSRPDAETLNGFIPDFWHFMTSHIHARYCVVSISDATNSAGFITLGRAIFAPVWQPASNIAYGCSVGWDDPDTTKERSLGGVDWYDQRARRRFANVSLELLSDSEAFHYVMDMTRRLGISGEMYFIFDSTDTDWWLQQRSFLATMDKLTPLQIPNYGINTAGFSFTEVL